MEEKNKLLYNPLDHDFTLELLNDENEAVTYTINSLDIARFEPHIYSRMEKHLTDMIANERELGLYDTKGLAKIKEEIHAYDE